MNYKFSKYKDAFDKQKGRNKNRFFKEENQAYSNEKILKNYYYCKHGTFTENIRRWKPT